MQKPYPLRFVPIYKEKVWGGRRLERFGRMLPAGAKIGESWEIADLDATSPGGGGGAAAQSVIANGALRGRTLREAIEMWGADLRGQGTWDRFPLLVKFLDAQEHLSVQVHPSEAYARAHPGAHVKSEAWVVVDRERSGVIFAGLRAGVTREQFERAVRSGEGVVDLLEQIEGEPGSCVYLPSGTVHALGAGVMVLEVQTASDTTFRVYDWAREYGRQGRALHVDEALACAIIGAAPAPTKIPAGLAGDRLCLTPDFDIWSYALRAGESFDLSWGRGRCVGLACLAGRCDLRWDGQEMTLEAGGVTLVAACLVDQMRVQADEGAWVVGFGVGASAAND